MALPVSILKILRIYAIYNLIQMASQAYSLICANRLDRTTTLTASIIIHIQQETLLHLFYLLSVMVAL